MPINNVTITRRAMHLLAAMIIPVSTAVAHEAWLQPTEYRLQIPSRVKIDVMAGENFSGNSLSYNPVRFSRLQKLYGEDAGDINGRLGDLPAVQFDAVSEGLYSVIYQAKGSEIYYETAEKFEAFVEKEGLDWVLQAHRQRGLPAAGFSETFYRYCKTLVGVGGSEGQDQYASMPFELVALENPLISGLKKLNVRLLWQGETVSDGQISVYQRRAGDGVSLTSYPIESDGKTSIKLEPGAEYLLNAVRMEPTEPIEGQANQRIDGPLWQSHWASLTFATAP